MCKINGKKLKEIREREGLTLQDVAKGCGVSYSTISKYESEINNPSDATVELYMTQIMGLGYGVLDVVKLLDFMEMTLKR